MGGGKWGAELATAAGAALAPGETRILAAIVLYLRVGWVLSAACIRLLGHPRWQPGRADLRPHGLVAVAAPSEPGTPSRLPRRGGLRAYSRLYVPAGGPCLIS